MAKIIDIIVAGSYKGSAAIKNASADVEELGKDAKTAKLSLGDIGKGVGVMAGAVGAAFGSIAVASKMAWDALKEGSVLADTKDDFDGLAASIGTTADALEGRLQEATAGLVSNTQLIADATTMMGTNLGLSEDRIVAFAGAAAELDWDLNTLTDTLNTKMTRGLKELGVNISETKARINELEEAGYSADDAFQMALLEAAATKIELVGKKSDEAAGQIQIMENAWVNAQDAFKEEFARQLADDLFAAADGAVAMGAGLDEGAKAAARFASGIASVPLNMIVGSGQLMQIRDMRDEIERLGGSMEDVGKIRRIWLEATLPGTSFERIAELMAEAEVVMARVNGTAGRSGPPWQFYAGNVDLATAALEGASAAAREFGEVSQTAMDDFASYADVPVNFASIAGQSIKTQLSAAAEESATAAAEAHAEAAIAIAARYQESAALMTDAFIAALDPDAMPDFGNTDVMKQAAFDLAGAFGLTVPVLSEIGVGLGTIDEKTAELGVKASLFAGAMAEMNANLAAGIISPDQWTAGVDGLIDKLNNMTVPEIQVDIKAKQSAIDDINNMTWLPDAAKAAMIKQVDFQVEDKALLTTLGLIDGIPDNDEKTVTFIPEDAAVLDAVTAINTAVEEMPGIVTLTPEAADVYSEITALNLDIKNMPGIVEFKPETKAVYDQINAINGRRITVYVDYVSTGNSGGGGADGDPNTPDRSARSTGSTIPDNRSGPGSSSHNGFPEYFRQIEREGYSW